jgi:hypothetical protein
MPSEELPGSLQWKHRIPINADWTDVVYVLQEIEQERRNEALAIAFETMASVNQNMAEGSRKIANIIRGGQQQSR